jgi:hypothetical protein
MGTALIGIGVGALIGVISSVNFLFMLRTLSKAASWSDGLKIVGEVAAIPTFWFGGPWITTKIIPAATWQAMAPWYVSALTLVFLAIVVKPLILYTARIAQEISVSSGR